VRHLVILLFLCSIGCAANDMKKDPLAYSYVVDSAKLNKSMIQDDLQAFLKKYNRQWSIKDKNTCVAALYHGQKEFNIDYKLVLAIMSTESQFNIYAKGKNRESIDYGLTQQNSRYIKRRYKASQLFLQKYKIKNSSSLYDIGSNIFSCYLCLRDIHEYSKLTKFPDYIKAYNVGEKGIKQPNLQNKAEAYYNKFIQEYQSI